MRKLASTRKAKYIAVLAILMLSLVPLGGAPAVAAPDAIYVDASNVDDPDENGSQAHPFDTIQEGINAASFGDSVQVAAGTYDENVTLKSGVIVQGAGADVTIIDGGGAETVVSAISVDSSTKLGGFTITSAGGTVARGIYISSNSTPTISNNIITNNSGGNHGIGIHISSNSTPTISNNIITNNSGGLSGEGIDVASSSATISNNIITNNGGGQYGFGINVAGSSAAISNNIIGSSSGDENSFGIKVSNSSVSISNNIITNNSGGNLGIGIHVGNSSANITNNTVANNSDRGISCFASSTTIANCIIWGNGDDLVACSATYSDIEDIAAGTGNIHDAPMFVGGDDYHLRAGSPCIDAGSNAAVPDWVTTDFEGDNRILDGDLDGTALVDMGADEYVPPTLEEAIWQKVQPMWEKMFLPQPTIVMLQGNITDDADNPVAVGSICITIEDSDGTEIWDNTFNNVMDNGQFDIPLGAAKELSLVPGSVHQLIIAIDVDSTAFVSADVTFGDGSPAGDIIKFVP